MNMKEAYYAVFEILDKYWERSKLADLGDMLSEMSPFTFKDDKCVSADSAVYANWRKTWEQQVGTGKQATPSQIYSVANVLLSYYVDELGYDLGESRNVLQKALDLHPDQITIAV